MPEDSSQPPQQAPPAYAANEKLGKINVAGEIRNSFLDY